MESNVFPGRLVLCGWPKSDRVRVVWSRTRGAVHLSDGDRPARHQEHIHLKPFTEEMVVDSIGSHSLAQLRLAPARKSYHFAGCNLGQLHHRPTHCADDRDHDVQTVKSFTTHFEYTAGTLRVGIHGLTDPGYRVIRRGNSVQTVAVEASTFRVAFEIRRELLKDFLSLGQKSFHYHAELLERRQAGMHL